MKENMILFYFGKSRKRSIIAFCAVLALTGLVVIPGCFLERDESDFTLDRPGKVHSIALYGKDTVSLRKTGEQWILNDGQLPDPAALDNFFYVVQNVEIIGLSTSMNTDSLRSVKIRIGEGSKNKIYRFYSGEDAYYIHHEGSLKLYRIQLLANGKEVQLEKTFSDRPGDWAKRKVIDIKSGLIQRIEVEYGRGQGFVLRAGTSEYELQEPEGDEMLKPDQEKAYLYTRYFEDISYHEVLEEDSLRSRISSSEPFYHFRIFSSTGEELDFEVHKLYDSSGQENLFYGAVMISGDNRILKINYGQLDVLFQTKDWFMREENLTD